MSKKYNKKCFLLPEAINSMAAVHAKVYTDSRQEYQFRISDCNKAIKLWGKIDTLEEVLDGYNKMSKLAKEAKDFANHLLDIAEKMRENEQ